MRALPSAVVPITASLAIKQNEAILGVVQLPENRTQFQDSWDLQI